nr:flagellin [Lachnospiraceae bacterium]
MIIQHNMSAANTNRQLGITRSNISKASEKLSSGYKINRAGDDAAGL